MSAKTAPGKLSKKTMAALMKMGIYTHAGGFGYDPIMSMGMRTAVMAIWKESEEPTLEEQAVLGRIFQKRVQTWYPDVDKKFMAVSANTVTLKKENGKWTYRKMTWRMGPVWHTEPDTLEKLWDKERL